MHGGIIREFVKGTATDLWEKILKGEDAPYSLQPHFDISKLCYMDANSGNAKLEEYLTEVCTIVKAMYSTCPDIGVFEAYETLRGKIKPFTT